MTTAIARRRSRFLKALAVAGTNQARWAQEHGVTRSHLSHVLAGRESAALTKKIDAFIRQHAQKQTALAG